MNLKMDLYLKKIIIKLFYESRLLFYINLWSILLHLEYMEFKNIYADINKILHENTQNSFFYHYIKFYIRIFRVK